jgi:amino acid adenylation domain-containing protein
MTENPPLPIPVQRRNQNKAPLSFSQDSLWFLQQLDPENNAYNSTYLIKFTGGIDHPALEKAINELVRRHEPFRTIYPNISGRPVQIIKEYEQFSLEVVDYSDLNEKHMQQALDRYISKNGNQPFNLLQGPLIRCALIHLKTDEDVFFFCTHHICSDAWSRQVFLSELIQAYDCFMAGNKLALSELKIQYADYAAGQREWLTGETLAAFTNHWKIILSGDLPILELPTDRSRPTIQTFHGIRHKFSLSDSLTSKLKLICQKEHITQFHLFLTAYAVLLMRYSGQEDIIVGCPFANRPLPELSNLFGLFVNTLPIRLNLSGNPSVKDLLKQTKEVMLDAFTWQAAPFEALVSEISPERDLSRTPVFQVAINMRNVPKQPQTSIAGLKVENLHREDAPAPFDLSLEFDDEGGSIVASLQYNSDLFSEGTITHMVAHYQNLLSEFITKIDRPISELQMLTPSEQQRILDRSMKTNTGLHTKFCLHELVETQVEKTPDVPAVSFEDQVLSYRQLNKRANQLAHLLRERGVGPETLVAMYVDRSAEMIVGLLAILKAGGAYLPIDPVYPLERREFILKDSSAPILLSLRRMEQDLPKSNSRVVYIDFDEEFYSTQPDENLTNVASTDNLAYVIYTSGSTGTPNGVMVTHHNVVRLFESTEPWFHFDSNDVWTMFHSYAFDFSVWEIWGALIHGSRLIVVPYLISRTPDAFYRLVETEGVTVLNQTPSAFSQFITIDKDSETKADLKLRLIIFGGEALDLQSLHPWMELHGDQNPQLVNMFGITETTIHVTYRPIRMTDLNGKIGSRIGEAIPDLYIYLLDAYKNLCPIGVIGEIYVGGDGVARGYLNRDELTSERFIPDPFHPGKRLYKSGDLARWHSDGDLEYIGRADFQVKIRGYRVELGEIESTIAKYTGIKQVIVVVREDVAGDKRLVSYLIPIPGAVMNLEKLREFVEEKLPPYMVPSVFVTLKNYPLTVNGKIDLRALPKPETDQLRPDSVAPRNDIEKRLATIWKDVLELKQVGIRDNFFELGGHSLLAVRLFTQIQQEFGKSLPLLLLFKEGTIEALANSLASNENNIVLNGIVPIQQEGNESPLFILPAGLYMGDLALALGKNRPLYALFPYENGKRVYRGSVQETAQIFYKCLTEFRPVGPFNLLGHSSDGFFALELARLLRKNGKAVSFLGMVDTFPPNSIRQINQLQRIKYHVENAPGDNFISKIKNLFSSSKREITRWRNSFKDSKAIKLNKEDGKVLEGRRLLVNTYKPEPYDGDVVLFKVISRPSYLHWDPMEQWNGLITGSLEVIMVDGNHMSVLKPPQVNLLAEKIISTLK